MAQISAATFIPCVPAHSWQSAACAGMSIGYKGMLAAAKALVLTAVDLFSDPKEGGSGEGQFRKMPRRIRIPVAHSSRPKAAPDLPR